MKIVLSGNLIRYASFEREVELEARTVSAALDELVARFPDLRPVVLDGEGQLRRVHRLYLNGEVLGTAEGDLALEPNDELGILTAVAGG